MILHTINAAPGSAAFNDCLRVAAPEDAIVLLGNAVYAVLEIHGAREQLLSSGAAVYVLAEHAAAAGLGACEAIAAIDMDRFVALSEHYPRQQAWH